MEKKGLTLGALALILCALLLGDGRGASGAQVSNPASPTQSTSLAAGIIPGYLSGCTLSNNGLQGIDVAACNARDSGDAVSMSTTSATTAKALQTAWAVGSSAGCLDTGAIAASTWYHVWAILRTDTSVTDFLCSLSATAPTLPTNYTKSRRIGSVLTNGSSNIVAFTQTGDYFVWAASVLDINVTNPGTSAVTRTLTVATGVAVFPILLVNVDAGAGTQVLHLSDLSANDEAPSETAAPLGLLRSASNGIDSGYVGGGFAPIRPVRSGHASCSRARRRRCASPRSGGSTRGGNKHGLGNSPGGRDLPLLERHHAG